MSRPLSSTAQIASALAGASILVLGLGAALSDAFPNPWGVPMRAWEWVLLAAMWLFAGVLWIAAWREKKIGPTSLCAKCDERVPAWFTETIQLGLGVAAAHEEIYCFHCTGGMSYPTRGQTKGDYDRSLEQKRQKLAEADATEPMPCPVCERNVPRGEMQRASVKHLTEPGQSRRSVKQLVCDDCIASGEPLVAGARARREP